jgi:hypothetical protein
MRVRRTLGILAMALAALACSTVHAQTALPPVDPAACKIAPIVRPVKGDAGDLSTPVPAPTPISQEGVVPADEATATAVAEIIGQSIACQNAGDQLRMLAAFSDRWVTQLFSGYDLVFYDAFEQQVSLPATPIAPDARIELISISDVQLRADGAAIVTVSTNVNGVEQTSLLLLIQEDGGWKIDGAELAS